VDARAVLLVLLVGWFLVEPGEGARVVMPIPVWLDVARILLVKQMGLDLGLPPLAVACASAMVLTSSEASPHALASVVAMVGETAAATCHRRFLFVFLRMLFWGMVRETTPQATPVVAARRS